MIADIFTGSEIIEIQTRSFDKMRKKLVKFLNLYPVTIVYPVILNRQIIVSDMNTGELIRSRKSPLKGSIYNIFSELSKIKDFLTSENLKFHIVTMNATDYRTNQQNGRRNFTKIDTYPTEIISDFWLENLNDYANMLPDTLEDHFTTKDLSKALNIKIAISRNMLNVMYNLGIVDRIGKNGNTIIYKKT